MSGTNSPQGGLTRRSFLKTTGAVAGAAAAIGGTSSLVALAEEESAPGAQTERTGTITCNGNCGCGCILEATVRDEKIVDIGRFHYPTGDEWDQQCQKGLNHIERIYDAKRLKYPLRRVGERGSDEWERISWDEAIAEITDTWKEFQSKYGSGSVLFLPGSGQNGSGVEGRGSYVNRLVDYMGAGYIQTGFDYNGQLGMTDATGVSLGVYGNDQRDLRNAKTILVWGTNPTESQPSRHRELQTAIESGAYVITIDPNFTVTAAKSSRYVRITPGTDGLLLLAMMKIIIDEKKQDEEVLKKYTVAPLLVKGSDGTYLRLSDSGETDKGSADDDFLVMGEDGEVQPLKACSNPRITGSFEIEGNMVRTAYDLLVERIEEQSRKFGIEFISETTGISVDAINDIAHRYSTGPSTILTGYGPDHYVNGGQFYIGICTLAMLSGNLVKPGCGISGTDFSFPIGLGPDASAINQPKGVPGQTKLWAAYIPWVMEEKPTVDGRKIDPHALYVFIGNPLANLPERNLWLEVFSKFEFIVVADNCMTETCKYADIILPAAYTGELEGYSASNAHVRMIDALVDPPYESKGDLEIFNLLGIGMGFGDDFAITRDEFIRRSFDNDVARSYGITWDRLKEEKAIWAFPDLGEGQYFRNGMVGFATKTGRAQFYFENIRPIPDIGQEWDGELESLFYWEPPHEAWHENELFDRYPIIFTTERARYFDHTMWTDAPSNLELEPEPYIKIHPDDASSRGIEDGDYVRVYNDRGYCVCKAYASKGCHPGVVIMDHGWQEHHFKEGHYSALGSQYVHPRYPGHAWFDILCEVELYGGGER